MYNTDFDIGYIEFTARAIHGTFEFGFKDNTEVKVPFIAESEDSEWLDKVCHTYKELYNIELEYYFDKICYFKEKKSNE